MKKIIFMAIICLLTNASNVFTASATNYFTLRTETVSPVNDTLWLHPNDAAQHQKMFVVANFDGYLDHWYLKITHPHGMTVYNDTQNANLKVNEGPAMSVPYLDKYGDSTICNVVLTTNLANQIENDTLLNSYFAASIYNTWGYWDPYNTGDYEPYGTVKWAAGYYDYMFTLSFYIPYGEVNLDLILDLTLTSTSDWRGYTVNAHPIRNYHIHVGYQPGDVTGSGELTIGDVGLLEDWLLNGFEGATPYQLDAADVDRDGVIDIADLQALIDILLYL